MSRALEQRLKLLICARQKLQAMLVLYNVSETYTQKSLYDIQKNEVRHLRCLLDGIDGLLLLVSEEEQFILKMHLVKGLKWETTIWE